jgi:hypothetical protein
MDYFKAKMLLLKNYTMHSSLVIICDRFSLQYIYAVWRTLLKQEKIDLFHRIKPVERLRMCEAIDGGGGGGNVQINFNITCKR